MIDAKRLVGGLVMAAAGGMATPAAAQVVLTQGVRVPPKPVEERSIEVSVTGSALYDSNIARSNAAIARARGLKRQDVRLTPAIAADIRLPLGLNSAYLNGSAGYDFYTRNTRLNGERIGLAAGVSRGVSSCSISVDGSYARFRSDLGDLAFFGGNLSVRDFRNIETTVYGGLSGTCGDEVGFRPLAQVAVEQGRNSNDLRKGSDYRTLTYGGGLIYAQPSLGEVGVIGSIERTDYDNRSDAAASFLFRGAEDFSVRTIGVYVDRSVTPTFGARLRLNYSDVGGSGASKSFNGISGEATVHVAPGGRFRFDATVSRAVQPELSYTVDYTVQTIANPIVTFALDERLRFAAAYEYRHRRYYSSYPVLIDRLEKDDIHEVSGTLNYDFGPNLSFLLSATYEDRNANANIYDYKSTRGLFTVRLKR